MEIRVSQFWDEGPKIAKLPRRFFCFSIFIHLYLGLVVGEKTYGTDMVHQTLILIILNQNKYKGVIRRWCEI